MALSHVPGSGPVSLERVAAGEVNETWRVARGGTEYALRLAVPGAADLGLDRHWECRVLRAAAAAGLAPALERCAPDAGVLVMRWRHGARWTCKEAQDPQRLERMADLVRRIQSCSPAPPLRSMSVEDWLVHYGDRLDARGAALSRHPLLRAQGATLAAQRLALAGLPACEPVLCHGDLHRDNLIDGADGLLLIDWEYAHLADPLWDLAGWSSSNDLAPAQAHRLLHAYLGRTPDAPSEARLKILRWMYEYMCLLWALLTGASDQAGGSEPET